MVEDTFMEIPVAEGKACVAVSHITSIIENNDMAGSFCHIGLGYGGVVASCSRVELLERLEAWHLAKLNRMN